MSQTTEPTVANGAQAHHAEPGTEGYNPHALVGSLIDEEEEPVPLFYFTNPLEAWRWIMSWFIPGMGMFCEAYFVFSIGNIKQIFPYEYPNCWKAHKTCTINMTRAPDYVQIIGIILGMCTLGYLGDKIGRKWGSVFTVSIMMVGCILLTLTGIGLSGRQMAIWYIVAQFVFGYGVGGEYPMAAGSAAERAEAGGRKHAAKRGREVVLTFSQQGLGNFTNVAVLLILMCCFDTIHPIHGIKAKTYHPKRLEGVWRVSFALGAIPLLFMIYYRVFRLRESAVWVKRTGAQSRGADMALLFKWYWHRLVATCGTWFLWDFSFYGNKVFQSTFIAILSPGASIFTTLLWTLLNSGIALIGYYLAATVVDNRYVGRVRLQLLGFLMVAILFYVSAIWYHPLTSKGGIHVFQFIYFFSSFWGQFGPNCTTFLLAGELYPTEVRTTAHGMSAGVAKLGALWAAVWFNYLDKRLQFWLTASFNIGGFVLTLLFTPDPLRVSLTEVDRRWSYIRAGKIYHGEAINPWNLSIFERMIGHGKNYNRAADEEDRWQDGYAGKGGNTEKKTAAI
jgi:MFS family permease